MVTSTIEPSTLLASDFTFDASVLLVAVAAAVMIGKLAIVSAAVVAVCDAVLALLLSLSVSGCI